MGLCSMGRKGGAAVAPAAQEEEHLAEVLDEVVQEVGAWLQMQTDNNDDAGVVVVDDRGDLALSPVVKNGSGACGSDDSPVGL